MPFGGGPLEGCIPSEGKPGRTEFAGMGREGNLDEPTSSDVVAALRQFS